MAALLRLSALALACCIVLTEARVVARKAADSISGGVGASTSSPSMSTESAAEVPMKRDQSALPDPRPGQNSTNGPVDAYYEGYFHPKPVDLPGPSMPVNPIKFVEGRVEIPSIDPSSVPVSPKRCWQELPHGVLDILADNRYAFPELLNQLGLTGYAVELGVLEGQYSAVFLSKWNGRKLYLVDPWENQDALQYNDINNRNASEFNKLVRKVEGILSPYAGRYEAIRRFSFEAASMFPDHSLDFVFIDANHSYEAVKRDLEDWWPKLRVGGMMAGHDYIQDGFYSEGTFGVRGAVLEFCRARCIMPMNTMRKDDWGVPNFYFFKPHPVE